MTTLFFSSLLQEPSLDNNSVDCYINNTDLIEINYDNEVPMESKNSSVLADNVSVSNSASSEINTQNEVAMEVDTPYNLACQAAWIPNL